TTPTDSERARLPTVHPRVRIQRPAALFRQTSMAYAPHNHLRRKSRSHPMTEARPSNHTAVPTLSFIDGAPRKSDAWYTNIDPSTGERVGDMGGGGAAEIDEAVQAARRAFPAWRRTTPEQRAQLLCELSSLIIRNLETLALLESEDSGKPLSQAR